MNTSVNKKIVTETTHELDLQEIERILESALNLKGEIRLKWRYDEYDEGNISLVIVSTVTQDGEY